MEAATVLPPKGDFGEMTTQRDWTERGGGRIEEVEKWRLLMILKGEEGKVRIGMVNAAGHHAIEGGSQES